MKRGTDLHDDVSADTWLSRLDQRRSEGEGEEMIATAFDTGLPSSSKA